MVGGSDGDDDEEGRCKPVNTYHSILLPYQKDKAMEGYGKEYGKGTSDMTQWSRSLAALVKGHSFCSQKLHGGSQLPVTSVLGHLMTFIISTNLFTHVAHINSCNWAHTHIINIL